MAKYKLTFYGREVGALGVFYPVSVVVEAETPQAAREQAFGRDDFEFSPPSDWWIEGDGTRNSRLGKGEDCAVRVRLIEEAREGEVQ